MNFPIEVMGILFLIFIFMCWLIYLAISKWWINKRYNPNDDKSRTGEEERRRRENVKPLPTAFSIAGQGKPAERQLLPSASIDSIGENSSSRGTSSNRLRNFFKRT